MFEISVIGGFLFFVLITNIIFPSDDETPESVVGVVGKAYTWKEVLQRGKEQYESSL